MQYKGDNPADCIEIGSIGPCSQGTCGMTGMSELNGDVVVVYTYTYGCKNTMTLTLTKGQDPAPGQVTSNECSYTASWAVLGTATCRSYVGTAACESEFLCMCLPPRRRALCMGIFAAGHNRANSRACAPSSNSASASICPELGPLANLTGPALIVVLVALCLSLVFPCCVLGIAWGTCIASKRVQGRSPTGVAWGFCCLFFFLSLVGGFFLPFVYYICSTVMIFPFCLGSDIFYTAPTTPTVVHTPGSPAVGVSHLKYVHNPFALCFARAHNCSSFRSDPCVLVHRAQSNIQAPLLGQPNPAPQFLSPQQAAVRYTRSGRRIG